MKKNIRVLGFIFLLCASPEKILNAHERDHFSKDPSSDFIESIPSTFKELQQLPLDRELQNQLKDLLSSQEKIEKFLGSIFFAIEQKPSSEEVDQGKVSSKKKGFKGKVKHVVGASQDFANHIPGFLERRLKALGRKTKNVLKKIKILNEGGWKHNIKESVGDIQDDMIHVGNHVKNMYKEGKKGNLKHLHTYVFCTLQEFGKAQSHVGHLIGDVSHIRLIKKLVVEGVDHLVEGQKLLFLDPVQDLYKGGKELIKDREFQAGLKDMGLSLVHAATGIGILGSSIMNVAGPALSFTPAGSLPPLIAKQVFSLMSQTGTMVRAGASSLEGGVDAIKALINHESPKVALLKIVQCGEGAFGVVTIIGANVLPLVIPVVIPFAQDAVGQAASLIGKQIILNLASLANGIVENHYKPETPEQEAS